MSKYSQESAEQRDSQLLEEENDIGLAQLWDMLCRDKWIAISIFAISVALSIVYALTATQWYRADVLMKLSDAKSSQGLSSQLGGLSGLANLAGVSIGGGTTAEPVAILKSRDFTGEFIGQQNLLPVFFANDWDKLSGHWKSKDSKSWPDIRDGERYFDKWVRTVSEDKKTGLVTLTIEWKDAGRAADWANLMVERLNDRMRQRALLEAEANVSYLRHELAATDVVELQQSIGRLLDSEMQKLMLAKGNKEFAFRVIDRAEIPKIRSRPKRAQAIVLGVLLGGVFTCVIVFVRRSRSLSKTSGLV